MYRNGGMEGDINGEGRSECLCVGKKLSLKTGVQGRKRENSIHILSTSQCQTNKKTQGLTMADEMFIIVIVLVGRKASHYLSL